MSEIFSISDQQIQEMVVSSLAGVFDTMLQSAVQPQGVSLQFASEGCSPLRMKDDNLVIGNVGFAGAISGMVYITMSESLAESISRKMLGVEVDKFENVHEMVNDVMGEITNMASGACRTQMSDLGYPCRLTIPSIIRGKYFSVEASGAASRKMYFFRFGQDFLTLELIMKMNSGTFPSST